MGSRITVGEPGEMRLPAWIKRRAFQSGGKPRIPNVRGYEHLRKPEVDHGVTALKDVGRQLRLFGKSWTLQEEGYVFPLEIGC